MLDQLLPDLVLGESSLATKDKEVVLGSGDGHIESPLIPDEANLAILVASHTVEYNDVPFLALEAIHCVDVVRNQRQQPLQESYLGLVRRDDADPTLKRASLQLLQTVNQVYGLHGFTHILGG
jgi:hypothetical protein